MRKLLPKYWNNKIEYPINRKGIVITVGLAMIVVVSLYEST
jgi:hypothetical protein